MPLHMRVGKARGSTSKDAMPIGPFMTYSHRRATPGRRSPGDA
jgi:hypothetical protein